MKTQYSQSFKDQAIQKVLQRGNKTIQCIADELNINHHTLKNWMKNKHLNKLNHPNAAKRPDDWTLDERLQCLLESHALKDDALNAFCRQKGIFVHHLESWKKAFISSASKTTPASNKAQHEIKALKKELNRKEKALAEAAALLVLQKKFNAFWEEKAP